MSKPSVLAEHANLEGLFELVRYDPADVKAVLPAPARPWQNRDITNGIRCASGRDHRCGPRSTVFESIATARELPWHTSSGRPSVSYEVIA